MQQGFDGSVLKALAMSGAACDGIVRDGRGRLYRDCHVQLEKKRLLVLYFFCSCGHGSRIGSFQVLRRRPQGARGEGTPGEGGMKDHASGGSSVVSRCLVDYDWNRVMQ